MNNTMLSNKGKKFRDPIHGFIHVSPEELEVINSPVFQRAHNIKQLSLGYYVYHGAEHSRFGHMLGAAHIAGLAYDSLKQNTEALGETFDGNETDRKTLRMAALLHDVGHAPFSHSLEDILDDNHEKYSQTLVKYHFADILKKADIDPDTVNNLIEGVHTKKPHLSKIVSGQLDVDRLDYLLRDSHYSGVSYGKYDLGRIIDQLAIVDNKFVVLQGGYEAVEQLIFARYQMYQQVYFHKTKRAFELMLWKCGEILKEKGLLEYPKLKDLENASKIEDYIQHDDRWFLNLILSDSNPNEVKTIANMIKGRKPYWESYSPISYRKQSPRPKTEPDNSVEALGSLQTALINELSNMGIEKHEFLTDELFRSTYKLMPDYTISDEPGEERNSILIYYKNNRLIEPIEKRSHVVFTLAKNQPFMIRGFVIPKKYHLVRDYLERTFDHVLPKRQIK